MITNPEIKIRHHFILSLFGTLALLDVAGVAHATNPAPITNLSALTTSGGGKITLNWTSPDDGASTTVDQYLIRYRTYNSTGDDIPSGDETRWATAIRLDGPPLYKTIPGPKTHGSTESLTIDGLTPSVNYVFAIRSKIGIFTSTGWNSATAQASDGCGPSAFDGTGLVVFDSSNTVGDLSTTTMTFTVPPAQQILEGGGIVLRVPDFWATPWIDTSANNFLYEGVVRGTFTSVTGGLTLSTSGQMIIVTVNTGTTFVAGDTIKLYYAARTCNVNSQTTYRVFSRQSQCGQMREISGTAYTPVLANSKGRYLNFEFWDYLAQLDQVMPIRIKASDGCGNPAPLISATTFTIKGLNSDYMLSTSSFVAVSSGTSFVVMQTTTMAADTKFATFYYRLNSADYEDRKVVGINYNDPISLNPFFPSVTVRNLAAGISSATVDTGISSTTATTVTFTPDNDGIDDFVYINFNTPQEINWEIQISSDTGFQNIVRRLYGYGKNNRSSWDGYTDWSPNSNPSITNPALYYFRILLPGGGVTNTTLSATLSAKSITGLVTNLSATPLAQADINIFGPSQRFVRTNDLGLFEANGLRAGTYYVRAAKNGYSSLQKTVVLLNPTQSAGTFQLSQAAELRVSVTRPTENNLPEIFGNLQAATTDWMTNESGNIHFGTGKTKSDAGDFYNTVQTTYTLLSLIPNRVYNLHLNIQNYGVTDSTISLNAGEIKELTITLTRRANISGKVQLPPATVNTTGIFVSVEAGIDSDKNGVYDSLQATNRYWGGAWVSPGETEGHYSLIGVVPGTYTLFAQAPDYVRTSTNTVVVGIIDQDNVDFSTFTTGGVLSGTITVSGDTSALDAADGFTDGNYMVSINAWSPTTFLGTWKQITASTSSATIFYQLTGLENGTYEVYVHMPGFESFPPGQQYAAITSGAGTLNLNFLQFSGRLKVTLDLGGQVDYNNVDLTLTTFRSDLGDITVPTPTSNIVNIDNLSTGYYQLIARYATSGLIVQRGIQVVNGSTTSVTVNLSVPTLSISGHVTTAIESAPYNSLDYIVQQTTPTDLITKLGLSFTYPANRIVAKRVDQDDHEPPMTTGANPRTIVDEFKVFFATYDETGAFTIGHLTPGIYMVTNNGEMDNNFDNGLEFSESAQFINLAKTDVSSVSITLSNGYNVSGSLVVDSGISEDGRSMNIILKNNTGEEIAKTSAFLTGTSVSFFLQRIPSGNYVLSAEDADFYQRKYSAKDLSVIVKTSHLSNLEIKLLKAAKVTGQLRIKSSGEMLTSSNFSRLLPTNFYMELRANPWFPGGFARANYPLIGSDDRFSIMANPGSYDLVIRTGESISSTDLAQGKKPFVPVTVGGLVIQAGQTLDLGIIDLKEGSRIVGKVVDTSGNPIPNILIEARPSLRKSNNFDDSVRTTTNELGDYVLHGLDSELVRYYTIEAAPRPHPDDQFKSDNATDYGEVKKTQVDTVLVSTVNFRLERALGGIRGWIDSGGADLAVPFGDHPQLGAELIFNKKGNIPSDNPLGDIEDLSNPDGLFHVKGLVPGLYDMWALAEGFGSGFKSDIVVGTTTIDIGTVTLATGFNLTGVLTKPNGDLLNENNFNAIIAVRNGFEEVLIGNFTTDASGNILEYKLAGFKSNVNYAVLLLAEDDMIVLTSTFSLSGNAVQNFILGDQTPTILTQAVKSTDSANISLQFEFTNGLRNSSVDTNPANGLPDDSEPENIITLESGAGSLAFDEEWLSSDRKRARAIYTPGVSESSFTIRINATFVSENSTTGDNHSVSEPFTYFVGIGKQKNKIITNAGGGTVQLEDDTSEFLTQPGTFGSDPDLQVNVIFRNADTVDSLASQASLNHVGQSVMARASQLGLAAYPLEMRGAIKRSQAASITPLSSFYDVFLPAGINHFFPQGKNAQICLSYDTDTEDPYSLNIYYYNPGTSDYILENTNRLVDTENHRVCVDIAHASVFTVLLSSETIIEGAGGYTGQLAVFNFPNPFNLRDKQLTLQDPGVSSTNPTIHGTMIKVSVPPEISGDLRIDIFSITGEKVRVLEGAVTSGSHNYVEWDGRNESGKDVASGIYIGRLTIGGGNERFFKLAVVK